MSLSATRRTWLITILFTAVFLLKLLVVWQLKDHPLTQPDVGLDTTAYASLARQVLAGDVWLTGQAYFVSPLYIYFLAGVLALTDSFTGLRVLQVALGTMAVGFVFLMTQEWFGRRAGLIAAGLAAVTGLFTFYESLILQAALDPFLTAAAFTTLTLGLNPRGFAPAGTPTASLAGTPKPRSAPPARSLPLARFPQAAWFLVSGIVFGVATLNRPNMLAAVVAVAFAALVARRVRPAALLLIGVVVGMAPVTLRNVLAGDGSLVSSHGGLNFYIGNGPSATGFYRQVPGISPTIAGQEKDTVRIASKAIGRPVSLAEASDYFSDLAWQRIRDEPGASLRLFAKKFGYVFHAQHIALPYSFPFYAYDEGTALRWYAVGPWLIIPLGLVGLAGPLAFPNLRVAVANRSAYLIWLSFVPAYAAGVAIFFVAERYRLPVLIPLLVGAGGAIDAGMRAVASRRARDLVVPGAILLMTFALVNWKHGLHDGRWEEGLRMAEQLLILGRYDEADARVRRIEENEPRRGAARYAVGLQLIAVGQPARALPYLTEAATRDPGAPAIDHALGRALLGAGRPQQAIPHLQRGFDARLDVPLAGYDLAVALKDTGDFARAAEIVRRIVPAEDAEAEVWLRVGRLAAQVRAPDVADSFFKRGAELAPGDAVARQQYGLNLLLLGQFDHATTELAEAVRLNPRDPDSLAHLAYGEAKLGRIADARAHADAALAVQPDHALARQVRAAVR